jgi:hypothetical protein
MCSALHCQIQGHISSEHFNWLGAKRAGQPRQQGGRFCPRELLPRPCQAVADSQPDGLLGIVGFAEKAFEITDVPLPEPAFHPLARL